MTKLIQYVGGGTFLVRVANKTGYQIATVGDGVNIGAAGSHTRRGRVQPQMSGTLTTMEEMAVIINE